MTRESMVEIPEWVETAVGAAGPLPSEEARMELAIALASENVRRGGGPFAAVVFDRESGIGVAGGVNLVLPQRSSILHAEIVALFSAQRRVGSYTLRAEGLPEHELVASCDPCAMCLGATLWSGVTRLVCGAHREDAEATGFDEGPVWPASFEYLRERGVAVTRGVLRDEAADVLRHYIAVGGQLYNG